MTPRLTLERLSVRFELATGGGKQALSDIDLALAPGEFISVIGPSGGGKSTLLHCMGGLMPPTDGRVLFDGEPLRRPDASKAAFVFQEYSLFPWRRVLDNAAIGLRFSGTSKAARRARARECLKTVGMDGVAQSYPAELSGGMQQRVAIARALAMDPHLLLLDEPFGALDEQTRRILGIEMSASLTAAGQTVAMITHSLDEAIFWSDRVIVLSAQGRLRDEIAVPGSRPRSADFMLTEEFAEIRADLWRRLVEAGAVQAVEGAPDDGAPAATSAVTDTGQPGGDPKRTTERA